MKHNDIFSENLKKKLQTFETLLKKWQKAVNLVSKNSLGAFWERHVLDSAQLFDFVPQGAQTLVDLGSGAGFPGLILALMAQEAERPIRVHLVESDTRKCVFLQECARQLNVPVVIHNCRIEEVTSLSADVITARALADLKKLLQLSQGFWMPQTRALFLKGARVQEELAELPKGWLYQCFPSKTDPEGVVVEIRKEVP